MTTFEHPAALAGPPIDWPALRRVLVVRPDNLGDVLTAGPAVAAVAAAAPHARVDVLASPAGEPAARLLPGVADVVTASVSWQRIGDSPGPADPGLVPRLAARGYDAALLLTSFSQSPWPAATVCHAAGIPVRAGLSREFGGAALTHWVPSPDDGLHQVDRSLYLLDRLGARPPRSVPDRALHVDVPDEARRAAAAVLRRHGLDPDADYVVVLPGASCAARRYPPPRFAAAARGLVAAGLPVVVCGSGGEAALVTEIATAAGAVAAAGELDVAGLAALLAGAAVAVTGNSGGMHLADAVGTPLVVLFSGTEQVEQYRPRAVAASILQVATPCSPCRQFDCPFGLPCLDVPPAVVVEEVLRRVAPGPARNEAAQKEAAQKEAAQDGSARNEPVQNAFTARASG